VIDSVVTPRPQQWPIRYTSCCCSAILSTVCSRGLGGVTMMIREWDEGEGATWLWLFVFVKYW